MSNFQYQHETLIHRISTVLILSEDFTKHSFLSLEILIKTLRDTHRFQYGNTSHLSGKDILDILDIPCTQEEKDLVHSIEHSLRKTKDYTTLCQSCPHDVFLSITHKLKQYIISL